MYIDKVTINYGEPIQIIEGEEGSLTLLKNGQKITIIPDELSEIIQVAKLLHWEDYR